MTRSNRLRGLAAFDPKAHPKNLQQVNKHLRELGLSVRAVAGTGYYYFLDESDNPIDGASVYIYRASQQPFSFWEGDARDAAKKAAEAAERRAAPSPASFKIRRRRFDGLAANGQRGSSALPLATLALVGVGAFIFWRILRSGESESYGPEAVGTGSCANIDAQSATPKGCGTVSATGYQSGDPTPITLSEIPGAPGYYLQSGPLNVWAAFLRMRAAAARDGVTLGVNSAFRTMTRQRQLYAAYLAKTGNLAAKPGYSNHQMGSAIDLAVRANYNVLPWLRANAGQYGFWNSVSSEDWHWQYDASRDKFA